jgi:glycosyltransferase involved in cell wall biosynthesis
MVHERITVAFDVGPLHGRRTGVGNAVAWTLDALSADPPAGSTGEGVELAPYITSMRARVEPPQRRLPIPAAAAMRLWARPAPRALRHLHERWLGRPDLVHGTNYVAPPTTVPTVISVYDCWFLEHPDDAVPDVRRAADVLRRAVGEGAHVIASSRATATQVRQLLDTDRVTVIHLGPPPPLEVLDGTKPVAGLRDTPFVLALGSVEKRKNYPVLVRAFGRVATEHPSARLVIAGAAADDQPAVTRAVEDLDHSARRRVMMLGTVDEATKTWLVSNARTLAYPSLDEGFGFPVLEAQAAGTPVVASTAGSIPEIAGSAALVSPPNDVDALAANLYWVLNNEEMREKLSRRGRENVKRFSWERTASELTDLYRRLLESPT